MTLATEQAQVIDAQPNRLTIIVPDVRGAGRIRIEDGPSVVISSGLFTVPAQLTISPDSPSVTVGGSLQFSLGSIHRIFDRVRRKTLWMAPPFDEETSKTFQIES